jgi:hypothetical protein
MAVRYGKKGASKKQRRKRMSEQEILEDIKDDIDSFGNLYLLVNVVIIVLLGIIAFMMWQVVY